MIDVVCHYYEDFKAPLLRQFLIPLARSFPGSVHLDRHWLRGPHVLLRFHGPGDHARAAEEAADACRRHLAAFPSTAVVDPAELVRQAELAGRAELVPGPYAPLHPDNSVLVRPADLAPLVDLLGSRAAVLERCELLALGLGAVERSLELAGDPGSRVTLALVAITAHAAGYPTGLGAGYQSFLSHVADHLAYEDPDGSLEAAFERQWAERGAGVTELVRTVAEGGVLPGRLEGVAAAWRAWSRDASAHADAALDTAALVGGRNGHAAVAARFGGDTEIRWDFTRRHYSEYHQLLNRSGFEKVALSRPFGLYRFGTNVLYRLLALCDLRPVERYLAAYLFSEAVERITGRTWRERLSGAPA
ncbi:hypothetical protein ABZ907_28970 [Nonomuraea wenchangensis]